MRIPQSMRISLAAILAAVVLGLLPGMLLTAAMASNPQEPGRSKKNTKKQLEAMACGELDRKYTVRTRDAGPEPPVPTDKALVYVIRWENADTLNPAKLAVDRKVVGINKGKAYFTATLEPGPHYFCSEILGDVSLLSLVLEAGKTYYLQQRSLTMGPWLGVVGEQKAKQKLAKCKLSTFEEKK